MIAASCLILGAAGFMGARVLRLFGIWCVMVGAVAMADVQTFEAKVHRNAAGGRLGQDTVRVKYVIQLGAGHPTTGVYQYRFVRSGNHSNMNTPGPITTDTHGTGPRFTVNNGVITENPGGYEYESSVHGNINDATNDANGWSGDKVIGVWRVLNNGVTDDTEMGSFTQEGVAANWGTVVGGSGTLMLKTCVMTLNGTPPVVKEAWFGWNWQSSAVVNHTLALFYNGASVFSVGASSGTNGTWASQFGTFKKIPAVEGDTYQWKVDGVVMDSGVVHFPPEINIFEAPMYGIEVEGTPTPPTPTAAETGGGNVVPGNTPTGGGSTGGSGTSDTPAEGGDNVIVNNNNRTISGTANGATNQDIYNDVRMALNTSGNQDSGVAGIGAAVEAGDAPDYAEAVDATSVKSAFSGKVTDGKAALTAIQPVTLPSSNGTKTSFAVTLPMYGAKTIELSTYSSSVSIFRSVLLFVLTITFYFATIKIIRRGIA